MDINEKTMELVSIIKSTGEFAELKQAKTIIERNRTLRNEVDQFNKQQMEVYSGKLSAKEAEARIAELNKKFGNLSKIPEVDSFLKATGRFNEMLAKVYKNINESIEADLRLK